MKEKHVSEAIEFRRSVRIYDNSKQIESTKVKQCIYQSTLSPSSSNMQLWEFHHIVSNKKKKEIIKNCFNQSAAKTAKQFVIIVVRKDLWKKRLKSNIDYIKLNLNKNNIDERYYKKALKYYKNIVPIVYNDFYGLIGFIKKISSYFFGLFSPTYREVSSTDIRIVSQKSAALAAQSFMISMSGIGYDTCPMEGFDSLRIKKNLNLPSNTEISMIIACGIRHKKGIFGSRFRVPMDEVYSFH